MSENEKALSILTTKSIGFDIVDIEEDIILEEKPQSRLIFKASLHSNGIRGRIIRQRRESATDSWESDKAIDIRTIGKNEFINIDLPTEAISNFYIALQKLSQILNEKGIKYGENKFAVIDPNSVVITEANKVAYINKILEAGYSEEVWKSLVESNSSLVTKLSYSKIQNLKKEILDEFDFRLKKGGYSETTGNDSWQKWIYQNNWLFGINYKKPIEKTKINITGVMPDFLFPTLDGFVDLLEIKLPNSAVLIQDTNHPGSWRWDSDTNTAIGQVVNYIGEIDRLRFEIERSVIREYGYSISLLRPRSYILIGDSTNWPPEKKEALRKMNYALHGIIIITYKDLYDRGLESTNFYEFLI